MKAGIAVIAYLISGDFLVAARMLAIYKKKG
jgi:hypothetical protein